MTLSSLSQSCLDLGVKISEQGLDDRIDETSVAFLRELFEQAAQRLVWQEPLAVKLLAQFSGVYWVDSTQIRLPATLAALFPGSGGNASSASLKLQLVFDYLNGHLEQLDFTSGCDPDQGYRGHWSILHKGALLMDLGYFALDTFRRISEERGYFLSRFQSQTGLLTPTGEPLVLTQVLAAQTQPVAEMDVRMGKQHQIPCRLILLRLPQEAADRQRQKARANAKRHGRTATQAYLKLLDWALFVTNVPTAMLQTDHVATLYRLRWQIELVFKLCKRFCGLAHIASLRPARIFTELYARLIGLVLTYFLIAPLRFPQGANTQRELSPVKVRLILQRFARTFLLALSQPTTLLAALHDFFHHVRHGGFKQHRRKNPNALQSLALLAACYPWPDDDCSLDSWLDFPADALFTPAFCLDPSLA